MAARGFCAPRSHAEATRREAARASRRSHCARIVAAPGIELARCRGMHIRSLLSTASLIGFVAAVAACVEPVESSTTEASTTSSLHRAKANLHGVILSVAPSPLGCFSLEGSAFIADPLGNSNGATITTSDCHWNAAIGQCECDVTIAVQ
jgi:hypothetical protein